MGVRVVDGSLLDSKAKYICHQVNCQGKMGSGVARAIRERYPVVYKEYSKKCGENESKASLLGTVQVIRCGAWEHEVFVCNLFGQLNYGYDGKVYTDVKALESCFRFLNVIVPEGETIAMPYMIGCGLGGADWYVVRKLIERELGQRYDVELRRFGANGRKESKR